MVNRAGYKVYCVEVENALAHHPGVLECAVVGEPCPVLGERVRAVVVPRDTDGDELREAELQQFCRQRLSDYKVPEFFTFRAAPLPRNANGKVIKRQLREGLSVS